MFSYVVSQFVILFVLESLQITWTVLMISRFASITRTVPIILRVKHPYITISAAKIHIILYICNFISKK